MKFNKAVVAFFSVVISTHCFSQQFGGNPPSVKWEQVNTRAARVIFPRGLDSTGVRVAAILQQLSQTTQSSIGTKAGKVDVVLQKETTISNAYVALGPFRSEFNLTPSQNSFELGSLPWYKQLAIHEFRHVQQNNNFNVGLSKAFRVVFGQEGQALANSLVVADWFYEGDAVYNETNVSGQGRGRLPFFFNDYRSLWADGRNYSWMKLRNGSLRDFTPDHYRLGYMLVAYGRQKYGNDFWRNVTHDAAAYKGLFYPFQRAVKRYAKIDYPAFRNDALQFFESQYSLTPKPATGVDDVPPHFLADEENPVFIDDSTVVFVRSSYNHIPGFIIRRGNKEKRLRVHDISLDNYFSYRNGIIVYASYRPDARWGWKDYSDLNLLDVHTGKQRSLTARSKYFSPDISPDGSAIIAVRVEPGGGSALHLLDAGNGKLIKTLPNVEKLFYTYPKFWSGSEVVSAVRDTAGLMSMALINLAKGSTEYLTPFSYQVLGFPFILQDTLYFTAAKDGRDRLFACTLSDKNLYQLIPGKREDITGDYQITASNAALMWSHFTSSGYRLRQAGKKDLQWKKISAETFAQKLPDFGIAAVQENPVGNFTYDKHLSISAYSKSYRLINFHSLEPLVDDPVYSFSFVGENVLNTLQSELFLRYNRNEQYKQAGFNAIYGALFPYFSGGVSYTMDRRALYHNQRIYWNEWELRGGFNIPLNLSKGRNFTRLNLGSDFVYNQPNFKGVFKDSLGDRSFTYVNTFITFSNQIQQARQHIYPRFAQTLSLNFKKAVSNVDAGQFLATGYLYFPGFAVNHNLVLNAAFQQKDTLNQHSFTNNFPFSRGYTSENFYKMTKAGINYHFPLFYPDAGFGNIVYLLRIRANLFYDHTFVKDFRLHTASFRSAGTEIFFDTKWWNQLPLSFGLRYSYLLDKDLFGSTGSNRIEFVLPINILQR